LCYRTICLEAAAFMGEYMHPEVSMHTHPLGEYMPPIRSGDWRRVAELMLDSAEKLAKAGANLIICPDNTIHQAFDLAVAASPLPWIHIAEPVAMEAERRCFRQLAITGTKYLMASDVYPRVLKRFRIGWRTPDERDRQVIDDIIFNELVKGVVSDESRNRFNSIIAALRKHGCDAVVLGCTELPILAGLSDPCPLPTLDSTRLLAREAVRRAIQYQPQSPG